MADKAMSASSADDLDDNAAISSNAELDGDNRDLASADGTEARAEDNLIDDQTETEEGKADAKPKDERAELLAVVKKAIEPKKEAEDPEGASSDANGKKDGEGKSEEDGDKKPDAKEDTRFDKHPRFVELRTQVAELKPKAEFYDKITGFMSQNDLTSQEVSEGMVIMALMKRDPQAAYKALQPYMQQLESFTGDRLPQDLSERVDAGEISEAAAREMAALRAGREHTEAMTQRDREREQERQSQEIAGRRVKAVNDWADAQRSSDPDFAKLEPLVRDRARVMVDDLVKEGRPPATPEAAVQVVKEAYDALKGTLKPFRPQKPGIKHVPSSGSTSMNAQTQPKSSLDAARQGLSKAKAGR